MNLSLYVTAQESVKSKGNVVVEKTAPSEIVKGDVLPVTISVTNNLQETIKVTVKEEFGGADPVDMDGLKRNIEGVITSAPPYYEAVLSIDAGTTLNLKYQIKPLYFGRFKLPSTEVRTPAGNVQSNSLTVFVKCNQNGMCETGDDENALTCPDDCSPHEVDDLCNPLDDGICDPDCVTKHDPDCGITTTLPVTTTVIPTEICGNTVCRYPDENYLNCHVDCPSGSVDGYCDGVGDGRCDPDCGKGKDVDCEKPTDNSILIFILIILLFIVLIIAYKKEWLKTGS